MGQKWLVSCKLKQLIFCIDSIPSAFFNTRFIADSFLLFPDGMNVNFSKIKVLFFVILEDQLVLFKNRIRIYINIKPYPF